MKPPRFRFASIALTSDTGSEPGLLVNPQGAFTTNNLPLRRLIGFAYDLQDPEILGSEVLDSERYSIVAQAEAAPALPGEINQFRFMVRELLAERFHLQFHWETQPSTALTLDRVADTLALQRPAASDPGPVLRLHDASSLSVRNAPLAPLFTSWLSTRFGTRVINRTGLIGNYSFDLKWDGESSKEPGDEPFRTALREQLGLTLEPIEASVERLVVDCVDRPTGMEPRLVEIAIDAAILDRYVGRYSFPGASMSVSREGTKLFWKLSRQGRIEIFAASETEFFAKIMPLRIKFLLDERDRATALVLRQADREIQAQRTGDDGDA